jgi:hypothetical protein
MKTGNEVLSMSEISIAALAFVDSDIGSGPILKWIYTILLHQPHIDSDGGEKTQRASLEK